jgi:hypothetical protein
MTREEIGRQIVDWEARRDNRGRLMVYKLPAGDGGGSFEVAGINDRYHPVAARRLKHLIELGRYEDAEREAAFYIADYTASPGAWAGNWRTELFLRDTAFNRGAGGAAWILQHALGVKRDRNVGPVTLAALKTAERDTPALIRRLRASREVYERDIVGRDERSKFWRGLVNRWDKVTAAALG